MRSFIELDDAQAGFRPNRRATDHAFVLHDIIREHAQSRSRDKTFVLVLDFSKAFDRCHIPTLISKLANKGVNGSLIKVIANMYIDAQASLEINGKLGKPFKVSRGVAQGCVLSPLFFTVYMDDLMKTLRESGLGMDIGQSLLNALSFADDLALIATDRESAQKLLQILSEWCERNFFEINLDKSGVMTIGGNPDDSQTDLLFNGEPLKTLDSIKYLGFLLTETGSWDKYLDKIIQSARSMIGRLWHFFSSNDISFALKLSTARTLVLSTLGHGQDIIGSFPTQARKLDSLLSKVLRAALNQPRRTKSSALQLIAGQPSLDSIFQSRRLQNFIRISNLPKHRLIHSFLQLPRWRKRGLTVTAFHNDLLAARRACRLKLSPVELTELQNCTQVYSKVDCKRVISRVFASSSRIIATRDVQGSHSSSLLRIFDSFSFYPLLNKCGPIYAKFITWMTASTDIYDDKTDKEKEYFHNKTDTESEQFPSGLCRLCKIQLSLVFTFLLTAPRQCTSL